MLNVKHMNLIALSKVNSKPPFSFSFYYCLQLTSRGN